MLSSLFLKVTEDEVNSVSQCFKWSMLFVGPVLDVVAMKIIVSSTG